VVVLRREKSLAGIVPVFLNQRDGFRKQLDTSEVVGFLSLVFQPEAALVIPEEVLPGDAYRIGIGGAGVTGEEEEVPGDEGSLWLKYQRKKTDYLGRVKLLPEAVALIEKYRDDTRETLFPPQDYHTLRANMKSLRLMAGLSQDLVYHMGRHSFASLVTLEEGVPIETICKMLGHSNIKTTQIYARVTPKKLFEDMDRFVEATRDLKLIL
jgi:hypothetical protein